MHPQYRAGIAGEWANMSASTPFVHHGDLESQIDARNRSCAERGIQRHQERWQHLATPRVGTDSYPLSHLA
jgi:hypothetical protein